MSKKKKDWNLGVLRLLIRLDKKYRRTELTNIVKWYNNIHKLVWQESTMRLLNDEKKKGLQGENQEE